MACLLNCAREASRLRTRVRIGAFAVAACFITAPLFAAPPLPSTNLPTGFTNLVGIDPRNIVAGANSLNITTSATRSAADVGKFSVAAGYSFNITQPTVSASVLFRVLNDPTYIYGTLSSNGKVWLVNPAGIMVGPGGRIDTAGFVASTLNISNDNFLAGRKLFDNTPGAGNVINQGEIRTPAGGSVYLIGSNVANESIISTPQGETILAAGATVSLVDSATPGVKVDITGAAGNATNLGQITAEAGRIGIAGVIVRNSGLVNASSVVNEGGRIFLKATKAVQLDPASIIRADAGQDGKGGKVLVWGDESAQVDGSISARGGSASGDGGFIETSARKLGIAASARITTHATHGKAGTWLLDPYDFVIDSADGDITGTALSAALESNDVLIQTDDGSAFCTGVVGCGPGNSSGNGDIFVYDGITWTSGNRLTLSAYRDIGVYAPIAGGAGSTVVLRADNTGTGIGTVQYEASIATDAVRHLHIYYNPVSYDNPTNFSDLTASGIGPYFAWMLVNDENNLQAMATNLGGVYALGKNIDASATLFWPGGGFVPVGDTTTPFTGQLDGLGHTISGLTIGRPGTDHVGLFGVASGAVIKNVTLDSSAIDGQNYVGGLVGSLDGGSIVSSHSLSASIVGVQGVGGLAGQISGNAWVNDSTSSGSVLATDPQGNVGGLVGLMACCGSPTVQASYSAADVTGVGNLGGLVGWMQNGQINSSGASGFANGSGDNVGGLVGKAGQGDVSSPAGISNSSATGFVIGAGNVGGLVGENTEYSVVLGSDSSGNVTGSGNNIGGLVGSNAGAIVDSLAAPFGVSGAKDVGGLVGFNSDIGVVTNSHYDFGNVSVNGDFRVTEGALYSGQYLDWSSNGKSLSIGNYSTTLPLNGGYHEISDIHGLRDLLGFANSPGLKFRLTANIDLLPAVPHDLHIPYFSALEFDGAGHVVTGINLSLPNNHVGFIGRLDAGTVKNIGIVGGSVSGEGGVGGLVGLNKGGTVSNAYSTVTVTGGNGYDIGGLVGFNSGGLVTDSHAGGNVTGGPGSTRTGGLVGANFGAITNSHATGTVSGWREVGGLAGGHGGDISNSWATGPVSSTGNDVGGLVGHAWYGNISDSYATGNVNGAGMNSGGLIGGSGFESFNPTVIRSYATGSVTGVSPNTGGLIGYNVGGAVTDSHATGTVTGGYQVGGLVGTNSGGAITDSYSTGSVIGEYDVGGLAGVVNIGGSIIHSYSTGPVSGTIHAVGGLIGRNQGTIGNSYSTGSVTGNIYGAGGLVGLNYSDIDSSYSTGPVNVPSNSRIGGLVGWNHYGVITNSYSSSSVSGLNEVGGLVGYTNFGSISNSYSTGSVSGASPVGGLLGLNDGGAVTNSFWDTTTSGQPDLLDGRGTGLVTADMKAALTFSSAGWSLSYWNIADGAYPTLNNMPALPGCMGYDNCWTGAIDSFWATAGNWTAGLPGGSQTVKIDVAGTPTISLVGVDPSFGSLWLAENLDVDAGVTFTLSNLFTLASGTTTLDGTATVPGYVQTGGTLAGGGSFHITNNYLQSGGAIDGTNITMWITQASGPLNFSATRIGSANLNAQAIVLGPIGQSGGLGLTTDSLQVTAPVSTGLMNLYPKSYATIRLGSAAASTLSLLQPDLDNLTVGELQAFALNLEVNNGASTVTLANFDTVQLGSQVSIDSPLALTRSGSALYLNAKRIDINETISAGAGGVFLGQNASNVAYLVGVGGKTYPTDTVELSNAELNRILTTGPVTIGDPYNAHSAGHGPMQVVGPIDLTGITTQLRLVGNGITQAAGATITVPQLAADGYGSISLPEANQVDSFAAKSTNGGVSFANAGPLAIGKVETTASPYNFATSGVVAHAGAPVTVTAAGPLTISAAAGQQVPVFGAEVWLNFNGDLSLDAGAGGQAYVEAAVPATIHLDFSNSAGQVRFNGVVATAPTNGLAGPGTPDFIGFWDNGSAAVEGSTLLLANTTFSFGGISCPGYDNCWTGAVNSLWATGGNWTAGHAPTGSESAKVDVAGTPTIAILGVNPSFGSLWLAENLNVDAGVNFTLGNLFTLSSGIATFDGTASVNGYAQTGGTLAGSGAFTVTNNFVRSGGSIDRSGAMDIVQATGNLAFSATNVGALKLRAGSGDISLGAVTAGSDVFAVAGRNLTASARIRSEGRITLASGATHDGMAYSASGFGGDLLLGASSELSTGDGVTNSGKDILLVALAGSDARGSITQNAGSVVAGDTISFHGSDSVTLNGSVTAVNYSPAALNVFAGTDYLAPMSRTQYGGDILIGGNLDAQDIRLTANAGLSGMAAVVQAPTSLITVRGGQMSATAHGDVLLEGTTIALEAAVHVAAGYDSIGAADIAGKNVSLGRIEAAGAYITATGAILDGNGGDPNIIAAWIGGPVIQLRSKGGGSPGGAAISADTVTVGTITATVDVGAVNGGIDLRDFSATGPVVLALSDGASIQPSVAYYRYGDLALGAGHAFNAGSGGIVIGSGASISGIQSSRFGGSPAQLTLFADQDMSFSGALSLAATHVGLSATGTLDIGQALNAQHVTLSAGTLNVGAAVSASGDLNAGAGIININGGMSAQHAIIGAGTLNIGGSGGVHATSHLLAVVAGDATIAGGYLTTSSGDLEMLVGENLTIGNAGHGGEIWAGHGQLSPPFADASIAVGGNLTLNNGAHINAANDVFIDMLGASSVLALNTGAGGASYVLSDIGTGVVGTAYLSFLGRSTGGVLLDGVATTTTRVGGSGFYALNLSTPATPGAGLMIDYGAGGGGDDSIAAQLVSTIQKSVEDAATASTPTDDATPATTLGSATDGCTENCFGEDEDEKKKKDKSTDEGKDGKKEDKPAQKKVATCI
jgi:filamentous hemagglutinin family protein